MKLDIKKGTTSKRITISVLDSSQTNGAGLTGLAYNTSGLAWSFSREDDGNNGANVVTLATATKGTWSTGGFVEKDATHAKGDYEIGIPNAALASGSDWVVMTLYGATNMAPVKVEIQLVGYDPDDAVRQGLTALPNATAGAAGGLEVIGGLDCADGTAQAGANTTITLASGASATDNFYKGAVVFITSGTGAGQTPRLINSYVGSTKVATVNEQWATNPDDTSVYRVLGYVKLS